MFFPHFHIASAPSTKTAAMTQIQKTTSFGMRASR
jgi:hypothetical protein